MQELRQAIRALHDDSKRKLNQDCEMHGALESLFSQVQAVREGLATLSEAFVEESSKQHQRMLQVRSQHWTATASADSHISTYHTHVYGMSGQMAMYHRQHRKLICLQVEHRTEALEGRVASDSRELRDTLQDAKNALLCRIQAGTDHGKEAHQALHDDVLSRMQELSDATHSRVESMEHTSAADCQCDADGLALGGVLVGCAHTCSGELRPQRHSSGAYSQLVKHRCLILTSSVRQMQAFAGTDSIGHR